MSTSILGRAQRNRLLNVHLHDIRNVTTDRHRTVDDKPYGGGVGMVMMAEPMVRTLAAIPTEKKCKVILLSAKGKRFDQSTARRYAKLDQLIFVCGRYEGVDERILKFVDDELSIGDFVLTGGELPAMVIADAVTRLLPGVLGKDESSIDESFAQPGQTEYPQYTRPEIFEWEGRAYRVPKVLLSGDHRLIAAWKRKHQKTK